MLTLICCGQSLFKNKFTVTEESEGYTCVEMGVGVDGGSTTHGNEEVKLVNGDDEATAIVDGS